MKFIEEFWDNLANKHNAILIAFLNGFIFGARYERFGMLFGILFALIFAVFAGLVSNMIEIMAPDHFNLSVNSRALFTVTLITLLIITIILTR